MQEDVKMAESMKDYEAELEASFRTINEGDVIDGTVIDLDEEEVTLDLNYYTQGIIKVADLTDDPTFSLFDEVRIGDVITATVVAVDDGHGNIKLSKKEATSVLAWDVLKSYMEEDKIISVKIAETNEAGAICYVEGIRGFIPASRLALSYVEDTSTYMGKKLDVKITAIDREKEKLILSAKELLMEKESEEHAHKVAMIIPGTIADGIVESLQPYGAFVDIGDGMTGLVHISQICDRRITKPSEELKVGQKVRVKIINTNDGKISLSIKQAKEDDNREAFEAIDTKEILSDESVGTSLGDMFAKLKLDL